MATPSNPHLTAAPPPESSSVLARSSSSVSPQNSRSRFGSSRMAAAAAAPEEGWEGKMVGVHLAYREEGEEEQLELNRERARVAMLQSKVKIAATLTAVGREDHPMGVCHQEGLHPAPNAASRSHAQGSTMAQPSCCILPPIPDSLNAARRTGTTKLSPHVVRFKSSSSSSTPATSCSPPSFRAMQGGKMSKKRKSPRSNNIVFKSPLSRMMLSPRPGTQPASSPRLSSMENPSLLMQPCVIEQGELDISTSYILSNRAIEANQRSRKRNSPSSNVVIFRSPLSRMMLSPRLRLSSSSSSQGASSSSTVNISQRELLEIDLNVDPEEEVNHGQPADDNDNGAPHERRKEIPKSKKKVIFDFLLAKSKNGELVGHETGEASAKFSVNIRTVQRIWNHGKHCLNQGTAVDFSNVNSNVSSKLRKLPITSRGTLEDVSKELGVSKTKLHALKREGVIERVSNSIKPFLTDKNKKERLQWCISMLDSRSVPSDPVFKGLFDFVFIDEKWFYITRKTQRYYKAPDEQQPTRTCKSTNFMPKIMILCAFARPRFDAQANCTFDGKIGCLPFVFYEAAKRSSKNRRAGTIEMKPMESVKRNESREFLIDKVLPAIRAKWPREDVNKPIYIQQDNAPSHIVPDDKLFCEAAKKDGFDIRLISQPPNSPDFNILDLGFFSSIQSIQYKTGAKSTEELVSAVHKAFDEYPPCKANRIFLTLQGCMKEVMKVGGGNNYNIPHIRKEMLERQGCLPIQLSCDSTLVEQTIRQIDD